ncbi:MAG: 3-oxoadipate enol-lactonase [Casimicrobiaceae bacterium]
MPHADLPGARINYLVDGPRDAPWLTLSNSLGTDFEMWSPQVPALVQRFRVLRYDTRGHGASSVPPAPYTIPGLADDVVGLLDHLGVARTHLCGLSMGGLTAIRLALAAPERIDALVLCNTAARIGVVAAWDARISAVHTSGMESIADTVIERFFSASYMRRVPHEVARVRAVLEKTSAQGYAACCAAVRDYDARPEITAIRARTLVIAGTHDMSTPPAEGRHIAERVPGARYVELDAAHLSNIEQPDDFLAALIGHLMP